jgi:hypothetical protein
MKKLFFILIALSIWATTVVAFENICLNKKGNIGPIVWQDSFLNTVWVKLDKNRDGVADVLCKFLYVDTEHYTGLYLYDIDLISTESKKNN